MTAYTFPIICMSGAMSYFNFISSFDFTRADSCIASYKSLTIYNALAWEIMQGVQLIAIYDFYDPKTNLLTGSISRYSFGVEVYPLNIMEIKLQIRLNQFENNTINFYDSEYLIQTHFWF